MEDPKKLLEEKRRRLDELLGQIPESGAHQSVVISREVVELAREIARLAAQVEKNEG